MFKHLIFYCLLFFSLSAASQTDTSKKEEPLLFVDEMPEFPGGQDNMNKFIQKNVKYPKTELELGVEGTVYINFVVEKLGHISNVRVIRGIPCGEGLEAEAMRVINSMPNWKPGKQSGKYVRVQFSIPIKFTLSNVEGVTCTKELRTEKKMLDHFYNGEFLLQNYEYEKAIVEFSETLKLSPENAAALYNRGLAYLKLNKTIEACEDLNKAKKLEFKDAESLININCK
jgi:TonB family protein